MTLYDTMNVSDVTGLYIIGALFLIMGIILLCGKGANLIAGYNTLPKEKKEAYNEKILARWVGIGITLIGITVIVFGVFGMYIPAGFVYLLPAEVVLAIVFRIIGDVRAKRK